MDHNKLTSELRINQLIKKIDENRNWILRQLDKGIIKESREEIASIEREISKLILEIEGKLQKDD